MKPQTEANIFTYLLDHAYGASSVLKLNGRPLIENE